MKLFFGSLMDEEILNPRSFHLEKVVKIISHICYELLRSGMKNKREMETYLLVYSMLLAH